MMVRTRFAPSPTGYLHIGGARTALYAWLYARHTQGKFILRIEDTDAERSTAESTQAILDGMAWLGLDYDEGPYYQSQRFERYRQVAEQLLKTGHAYRCYCSKERLQTLRETQLANKEKPRYDGHCRNPAQAGATDAPYVVRFRNPSTGEVHFHDQVYGELSFRNEELDDLVLVRSDGIPTYNFSVVIDDHDMQITHVIRGDDHINNTPRQLNIFAALGAKPPIYAHVPMILGPDGKRLSKRQGAMSVLEYQNEGILPQALLNYLVRLGWSHGDQEIFPRQEMIRLFDLDALNKAPSALNPEKLLWLNQHYLKTLAPEEIAPHFKWHLDRLDIKANAAPKLPDVIRAQSERCKTLAEMAEKSRFFYVAVTEYEPKAAGKNLLSNVLPAFALLQKKLAELQEWSQTNLHEAFISTSNELGISLGQIAQPVRVAVSGGGVSPPIDLTLALLGKERVLAALERAVQFIQRSA